MKKIFIFSFLFSFVEIAHSRENWLIVPMMTSLSTNTSIVTTSTNAAVVSTTPVTLQSLNVISTGSSNATQFAIIEVWDSKVSTSASGIRKIGKFDTRAVVSYFFGDYGLYLSSGLAIYNQGSTAGEVTLTFRER